METFESIYVTHQRKVTVRESNAVVEGIEKVLKAAEAERIEVKNFYNWSEQNVKVEGKLEPYQSTDWYIEQGRENSERADQLKAGVILNELAFNPWQDGKFYDVLITHSDLYKDQSTEFVIGIAQKNVGTVVSTHRFRGLDSETKRQCLITETMHELGHVFGLPSNNSPDTTNSLGMHCTNTCVMRQGLNVPWDWIEMNKDRQKHGPFCERCQQDLKEFLQR